MKAEFDQNGYYTGNHAEIGGLEGWLEVERLPPENDRGKAVCYYLDDGEWVFDEERYLSIIAEHGEAELLMRKEQMVAESKTNLSRYLSTATLESDCHGGETKQYSITSEKQQYLATMIMTTQMAQMSGIEYQPSWNATGEECTYDWTLQELQQLAFEMEAVVRPLVSRQQKLEVQIRQARSLEELRTIDISYEGVV